jgi:hypothetical protein
MCKIRCLLTFGNVHTQPAPAKKVIVVTTVAMSEVEDAKEEKKERER